MRVNRISRVEAWDARSVANKSHSGDRGGLTPNENGHASEGLETSQVVGGPYANLLEVRTNRVWPTWIGRWREEGP